MVQKSTAKTYLGLWNARGTPAPNDRLFGTRQLFDLTGILLLRGLTAAEASVCERSGVVPWRGDRVRLGGGGLDVAAGDVGASKQTDRRSPILKDMKLLGIKKKLHICQRQASNFAYKE